MIYSFAEVSGAILKFASDRDRSSTDDTNYTSEQIRPRKGPSLQALVTRFLTPLLFPINFAEDFARRIRLWLRFPLDGIETVLENRIPQVKNKAKMIVHSTIKT